MQRPGLAGADARTERHHVDTQPARMSGRKKLQSLNPLAGLEVG